MRLALGTLAGAIGWMILALGIGMVAGRLWPEFAVASRNPLTLTTVMLATRLGISFVASLISGAVAARLGASERAALAAGVLLLLFWAPYHVLQIWAQFPIWYHLTFFVSLPLLAWIGGRFAPIAR
ncbi:MAG TPA: hypothetical protein VHL34_15660 [Rhizomicrobium sp.]|jgi:hypothetical protein|nr:hypothetical protein [Rhizomicrobium sp.]